MIESKEKMMRNVKKDRGKIIYIFALFLIFLLFALRAFGLDKDIPNFGISLYQSVDEGIYSRATLNLFNSHNLFNIGEYELYTLPFLRTNVLVSIVQYLFMNVLGDNYTGFRIVSVLINFLILVFLYKCIKLICVRNKLDKKYTRVIIISILTFVVLDFSFLLSSRVIENSNMRALFLLILVYLFTKYQDNIEKSFFIYGFISIFSIFLVYFSNLFVGLPFILFLLIDLKNRDFKAMIKKLKYYVFGALLALAIAEIYYIFVWDSTAFKDFFGTIFNFSSRIGENTNSSRTMMIFNNFCYFFGSNIFFYSPLFLFLSLISLKESFRKYLTNHNIAEILPALFIISLLLQSLVARDYIERKAFTIYPMLLLCIVYFAVNVIKNKDDFIHVKVSKAQVFNDILIYVVFLVCVYFGVYLRLQNDYFLDFKFADVEVLKFSTLIQISLVLIYLFIHHTRIKIKFGKIIAIISCVFLVGVNTYFAVNYVYAFNYKTDKEAMIEIGNKCKNNIVMGARAYSYTLYNDIKPLVNDYKIYRKYIKDKDIKYQIEYAATNNGKYLNETVYGKPNKQSVYLINTYYRSEKAFGITYNIGLFEKNGSVVYEK